jgi:hypothetical protein
MSRSRPVLARWAAFGGLLLLGVVIAGLMAMHGVQTSGPAGMSGIPVVDMPSTHSAAGPQGPHEPMPPAAPMPGDHHPGGQVCLGLLVLAIALVLMFNGIIARTTVRTGSPGIRIRTMLLLVGRPPPSIYHLAVLRL